MSDMLKESVEKLKNDYLRGEYELDEFIEKLNTTQDNGLRKAAEKVVYEWHNSVGEECIDAAMVELVKVLNSKKH
jgi:NADPH-dependent curcumin reductase CurA